MRDVFVFGNRIHVQCNESTTDGSSSIRYFAVSTSDQALSNRLLTIGTTAIVAGRRFIAYFDAGDVSGNGFGRLEQLSQADRLRDRVTACGQHTPSDREAG